MPELPEVEVLVRHLARVLPGRRVVSVEVRRAKSVRPDAPARFVRELMGATVGGVRRRGKYLLFDLRGGARDAGEKQRGNGRLLVGHLGMTGRMYLAPASAALPRHAAVVIGVGRELWVFEDARYFGRLTFDATPLDRLGPEPLEEEFTAESLAAGLGGSRQAVKVRLLDQSVVAGVGNIYASEALYRAGIRPERPAGRLKAAEVTRLRDTIRAVLEEAIAFGSTVPLDWSGSSSASTSEGRAGGAGERLFYYGATSEAAGNYTERLRVYDRAGESCGTCGKTIRRVVQAGRSTFFCAGCQH